MKEGTNAKETKAKREEGKEKNENKQLTILAVDDFSPADNRRKVFEIYAKENGFDPLHAENWYSQPHAKMKAIRVCTFLI